LAEGATRAAFLNKALGVGLSRPTTASAIQAARVNFEAYLRPRGGSY